MVKNIFGWEDENSLFEINKLKKTNIFLNEKRFSSGIKFTSEDGIKIHPTLSKKYKISSAGLKEVVVKLIKSDSKSDMSGSHTFSALNYALSHCDNGFGIDEAGNRVLLNDVLESWNFDKIKDKNVAKHLVFSLPEKLTNDDVKNNELKNNLLESVKMTLWENFPNHKFVIAIHSHQSHLHAHIIINNRDDFTKKKMRYSKNEFKQLFQYLRDDFAKYSNMFYLKDGLRYCASSKVSRNLYTNEIDYLKQLNTDEIEKIKNKFNSDDKLILLDQLKTNTKGIENLKNNLSILENDLKKSSIHRHNLKNKIINSSYQSISMTDKLEKLNKKISTIKSSISQIKKKINVLNKGNNATIKALNDFDSLNIDVDLVKKRENFIKIFDKLSVRSACNKQTLGKIKQYKEDLGIAKAFLDDNLKEYLNDFSASICYLDDKTSIFELTKMLKNLNKYYKYLNDDERICEFNDDNLSDLNRLNGKIKANMMNIIDLVKKREIKLESSFKDLEAKTKKIIKDYNLTNKELLSNPRRFKSVDLLHRNLRNLEWIEKELSVSKKMNIYRLVSEVNYIDYSYKAPTKQEVKADVIQHHHTTPAHTRAVEEVKQVVSNDDSVNNFIDNLKNMIEKQRVEQLSVVEEVKQDAIKQEIKLTPKLEVKQNAIKQEIKLTPKLEVKQNATKSKGRGR